MRDANTEFVAGSGTNGVIFLNLQTNQNEPVNSRWDASWRVDDGLVNGFSENRLLFKVKAKATQAVGSVVITPVFSSTYLGDDGFTESPYTISQGPLTVIIAQAGGGQPECDANHRDLCLTQDTCLAVAESVWYEDNDAGTANCLVACPAGTEDSDNDRVCTAEVQGCVPDASECVGQTSRRVCQADGTWPAEAEMCAQGQTCQDGLCQGAGAVCGNSVIDAGETCDDGNQVNSDGCSSGCVTEEPPAPEALAGDLSGNGCYDSADIYEAGNTPTRGFIAFIQGLLGNNNNINSLNTFIWGMFNQWGQGCP